jgi:hypothetical protein
MSKIRQKRLINLQSLVQDAGQGYFEDVQEIESHFKELEGILEETRCRVIEEHIKFSECNHDAYKNPIYKHVKMVLGYIYVFEKSCTQCGYKETLKVKDFDKTNFPEGFEGAKEQFYNNYI